MSLHLEFPASSPSDIITCGDFERVHRLFNRREIGPQGPGARTAVEWNSCVCSAVDVKDREIRRNRAGRANVYGGAGDRGDRSQSVHVCRESSIRFIHIRSFSFFHALVPVSYVFITADCIRQYRSVAEARRVESPQIDTESGLRPVQDVADVIDIDWRGAAAAAITAVETRAVGFCSSNRRKTKKGEKRRKRSGPINSPPGHNFTILYNLFVSMKLSSNLDISHKIIDV